MSATQKSDCTKSQAVLHMALELSEKTWKLGFATGLGQVGKESEKGTSLISSKRMDGRETLGSERTQSLGKSCY